MRILQVSSARSIGGGEGHVIDLSNELAKRGHQVFAAVVPGSPLPALFTELPPDNVVEIGLRNSIDLTSSVRLAKWARRNRVDLINAHFAKDYPVAALAARMAGVPLVITRHVLFPMNRLHRLPLRNVKAVIAPSNAVALSLRVQGLFPPEKIATIRYGLDVDRFPLRTVRRGEGITIGSIGNLDPVKGFDILIRAAEIVSKQMPDVKFRIVGRDRSRDGRNERDLRALIDHLDLHNTVELAGWTDEVAGVLADFDVFASASRSESFGFVIAEAMLSGVPVVATATEGAKEIISDPALGTLVPVGAADDLSTAILELLYDASRRRYAGVARDHIRKNFSLERMVEETEQLYVRAIDGRR